MYTLYFIQIKKVCMGLIDFDTNQPIGTNVCTHIP